MELGNEESNNFQVLLFSENHKEYLSNDNLKFNMNFKRMFKHSVLTMLLRFSEDLSF